MATSKSVFGIYSTRLDAERAGTALGEAGFANADISVLLPENPNPADVVAEKSTKAPEGAVAGTGSGAVVGGTIGWLAGVGALLIPGLGPFLAAGPVAAALVGAGAGGALGGFVGTLIGLGIPESEAKAYEGRLMTGGILMAVHCATAAQVQRAIAVVKRTGAQDISTSAESGGNVKSSAA